MNPGKNLKVGVPLGVGVGISLGVATYLFTPDVPILGEWEMFGKLALSVAVTISGFGMVWFFTVLSIIIGMFNEGVDDL